MTSILILTHGDFGAALLATACGMLGPQERCAALGLQPESGREDLAAAAAGQLEAWGGGETLILVDMLGGTPWNVGLPLSLQADRELLSGASLPLLLEALSLRSGLTARDLGAALKSAAQGSVVQASVLLGKAGQP